MMNLSDLPTDNLYKFLALFGVAIVLVSLTSFFFAPDAYFTNLERVLTKEAVLTAEQHALEKRIEALSSADAFTGDTLASLAKDSIELFKDKNTFAVEETFLRYRRERLFLTITLSIVAFLGGAFIATIGFRKWYTKLQKYQDLIIERESRK